MLCGNDGCTDPVYSKLVDCTPNAGVETTAATCSVPGVTTYTCTVCGYQWTADIPATGEHNYVWDDAVGAYGKHTVKCSMCNDEKEVACVDANADDICDVCGAKLPTENILTLTTELHNGDRVVIWTNAGSKAMSTTANGTKLVGVDATISGTTLTTSDAATAVLIVETATDGKWYLKTADGKYLTSSDNNNLTFADTKGTGSQWTLAVQDATAGTVTLTSDASRTIEWYNNLFTTYNTGTAAAYQIKLYTIQNNPTVSVHNTPITDKLVESKKAVSFVGKISNTAGAEFTNYYNISMSVEFFYTESSVATSRTKSATFTSVYSTVTDVASTDEDTATSQGSQYINFDGYLFALTVTGIPANTYTANVTVTLYYNDGTVVNTSTVNDIPFTIS